MGTEGVDILVRTRPASFQHNLSDNKVSQLVGARKANDARADTTLGDFGDVWRHDALTRSPPCSLSLGARWRQILCYSLDRRCKNIAFPSIVRAVVSLIHLLCPLLLRCCNAWGLAVGGFPVP